ncbi:MAG: hypothetical protein J6Y61_01220 [Bacteroidales bacterium]|nr:hypothetical protein [Bacteroidales bacterium]
MVNLDNMPLDDLSALVTRYPWFGAARKALCCRTGQFADAALYVFDRGILAKAAAEAGVSAQSVTEYVRKAPMEQKVVVVGGDYFTQDAYESVRSGQEAPAVVKKKDPSAAPQDDRKAAPQDDRKVMSLDDVYITETLAEIYAQQGYLEQAKSIYSKLILRYPEKSAYFATLIEKLNNINNQ